MHFSVAAHRPFAALLACLIASTLATSVRADASGVPPVADQGEADAPAATVAELVARIRPALVTIRVNGRDGGERGIGTGFVVSSDGLIATNLHVIGQGRRFTIEMAGGRKLRATAVHAFDNAVDLAVIRVDPAGGELTALPLSDSSLLQQGTSVVAMGNPWGLRESVVSGVVSAIREIDGQDLIQVAMPIEPGNSGGPLVDMSGRVHGVINMKSAVKHNVAFAVRINKLQVLLDRPNPVPIERWVTIGTIDEKHWSPLFGARWRQQAGRIVVSGTGQGFGGRSLCLSTLDPPKLPFEVGVYVKLDDEAGAAGLVFHANGNHQHYGFYPSNGKLRLSCFRGPTVYSWDVLHEAPSVHYHAGQWNHLKVRIEPGKLQCFVNDNLVIESHDSSFTTGRVGLAKFRQTEADFKEFRVGERLSPTGVSTQELAAVAASIEPLPTLATLQDDTLDALAETAPAAVRLMDARRSDLETRRRQLEAQIEELRKVSEDIRVRNITQQLAELLENHTATPAAADAETAGEDAASAPAAAAPQAADTPEAGTTEEGSAEFEAADSGPEGVAAEDTLLHGALLIAKLDEHDIDVDGYLDQVRRMAAEIREGLAEQAHVDEAHADQTKADEATRLAALDHYLFKQNGFHGSRFEYYHRANSYLNRVIDDREGLPITLAVLYIDLGRRLGLNIQGVGLPSHFIVKWLPSEGDEVLIDVFDGGRRLTRADAAAIVESRTGQPLADEHLQNSSLPEILSRLVLNLQGLAENAGDREALLRYIEARIVIERNRFELRAARAMLRAETGRRAAAVDDLDWILDRAPPGIDLDQVRRLREIVERTP